MKRIILLATLVLAPAFSTPPAATAAGKCIVSDRPNTPLVPPIQIGPGEELAYPCGRTITGSGCVVELTSDVVASGNGACLTLGGGVELKLDGHAFICPDAIAPCQAAITVNSPSAAVSISDGNITGCWATGIDAGPSKSVSVANVVVDLLGGVNCTLGDTGIRGAKSINRCVVRFAWQGVVSSASTGTTISDSIVRDTYQGILVRGGTNKTKVDNVLVLRTGFGIQEAVHLPGAKPQIRNSHVRESFGCNFADANEQCVDAPAIVELPSLNFLDDRIIN